MDLSTKKILKIDDVEGLLIFCDPYDTKIELLLEDLKILGELFAA